MTLDRRGLFSLLAARAADQALDVMLLQTAASVENTLIAAYDAILGLPAVTPPSVTTTTVAAAAASTGAAATVRTVLTAARARHIEHATACNDLAGKLGGRPQTGPNPALADMLNAAKPGLGDLANALDLATTFESTSLQTHQNAVGLYVDVNARRLAAMILGIEAQHLGILLVGKGLVAARTPELFSLEAGTAARLPPDAAKAGFPESFSRLDRARPAPEGAVK